MTDANVQEAVPFFAVSKMEESLAFYVAGLGFTMTERWSDGGRVRWCRLELEGAAVMLQEYEHEGPDAWRPEGKVGIGVSIYFICRDAPGLYHGFIGRGVDAKRPFVGNRMWVTSLVDPDGYRLHFESPTDAPEGSRYEE